MMLHAVNYKKTPNTLHYALNPENSDTKVNTFPAKKERKKKCFTSYSISFSVKVIKMQFTPKDSTFMAKFRNRKLQKTKN